ncbi:MAG: metallophosphoesterase [Anaerolineales bacterium]|nr:metallophosphoesterase [Anaerolineales bacterium]
MSEANKKWQRIVDLTEGQAMVVTDLHGDWDAYRQYRDTFFQLRELGQADILILDGDLIHASAPASQDKSLEIILDIIELKKELGDSLVCVLGNHELPHIYSITLQKGMSCLRLVLSLLWAIIAKTLSRSSTACRFTCAHRAASPFAMPGPAPRLGKQMALSDCSTSRIRKC